MSKFFPLTIAEVRQETRDTIVATFAIPTDLRERFAFTQGQHLTLRATIKPCRHNPMDYCSRGRIRKRVPPD